jgi:hypothetical protein
LYVVSVACNKYPVYNDYSVYRRWAKDGDVLVSCENGTQFDLTGCGCVEASPVPGTGRKKKGISIAPIHPFRASLGAESRVCFSRQATTMSAHVLLLFAVNSKSKRRVDSLPPLGFEPATFGMLSHLSDR